MKFARHNKNSEVAQLLHRVVTTMAADEIFYHAILGSAEGVFQEVTLRTDGYPAFFSFHTFTGIEERRERRSMHG